MEWNFKLELMFSGDPVSVFKWALTAAHSDDLIVTYAASIYYDRLFSCFLVLHIVCARSIEVSDGQLAKMCFDEIFGFSSHVFLCFHYVL